MLFKITYFFARITEPDQVYSDVAYDRLVAAVWAYSELRQKVSSRICYRSNLQFLKYKISLTNSLSNRLVKNGKFYSSYKQCREFYINLLRANFLDGVVNGLEPYIFYREVSREFLDYYSLYVYTREFDYVLYWRASQLLSIFGLSLEWKRKTPRYFRRRFYFIKKEKRYLFIWKWLAVLIKCCEVSGNPLKYRLLPSIDNFLLAPDRVNILKKFRWTIYKHMELTFSVR